MNLILMIAVTVIEVVIVYKIRYAYSRMPLFAIVLTAITIGSFYVIAKLSMGKYLRAYTFNLATVDLILLVIMLCYMYQMKHDLKNLLAANQPDFLIVLGNKCLSSHVPPILSERLDKAIELYQSFETKPVIIVSGGKSMNYSEKTEAEMMREYLLDRGIPDEKIVQETESINTVQNLEYSAIIVHRLWQKASHPKAIVVTSDFHIPRAKWHAQKLGLKVQFSAARTVQMLRWPAMFREFTAIVWYHRYSLITLLGMDFVFSVSMCM